MTAIRQTGLYDDYATTHLPGQALGGLVPLRRYQLDNPNGMQLDEDCGDRDFKDYMIRKETGEHLRNPYHLRDEDIAEILARPIGSDTDMDEDDGIKADVRPKKRKADVITVLLVKKPKADVITVLLVKKSKAVRQTIEDTGRVTRSKAVPSNGTPKPTTTPKPTPTGPNRGRDSS